jgi:hypothetical protein
MSSARKLPAILTELCGLFVEDGSYTLAILIWVGLVGFGRSWIRGRGAWAGTILFMGLAVILIENIVRSSRRKTG